MRQWSAAARDMRAQLGMAKRNSTNSTRGRENDSSKPARARAADETTRSIRGSSAGRSGGIVDAPGKKHRKPMPSTPGTKHSDTRIAKMKVMNESRRRGDR